MQLLVLTALGVLGLFLHVIAKLYEDYKAMLATPDESDDITFWQVWRRRNLVISIISLVLVVGLIVAQFYAFEHGLLTKQSALLIGYALDSALKNFTPKG